VLPLVSDPRRSVVIDAIEANGWAAELYDTESRLLWLSGERPGVTHKAVHDAAGVPVVHVPWARDA
jgi:hypothetical protein